MRGPLETSGSGQGGAGVLFLEESKQIQGPSEC